MNMQTNGPAARRRLIAAAAILIQLCLGTVYAWSIFKKPMMAACGWTEIQTQAAFMTYGITIALSVALGGLLTDRIGPRIVGILGGLLFSTGVILGGAAVQTGNVPLLMVGYGVVGGFGAGLAYVTPIATLIRWFPDKRGQLTGMAVMGYGLGSFIMGNLGPALIVDFGIAATFYAWGGVSLLVIVPAALVLVNPPENWTPPAMRAEVSGVPSFSASVTLAEAAGGARFWILWLIFFVGTAMGLGLISQLSPMVQDVIIRSSPGARSAEGTKTIAVTAGTVLAVAGIFNGVGRFIWGWLSDVFGRRAVFALIFVSLALGLPAMARVESLFAFAGLCFYLLACYGGIVATMPALAADEFGPAHVGRIYGAIFIASGFGGLCGPYVFAAVKEATGGFTYALYTASGMAVLGLALIIVLRKKKAINPHAVMGAGRGQG